MLLHIFYYFLYVLVCVLKAQGHMWNVPKLFEGQGPLSDNVLDNFRICPEKKHPIQCPWFLKRTFPTKFVVFNETIITYYNITCAMIPFDIYTHMHFLFSSSHDDMIHGFVTYLCLFNQNQWKTFYPQNYNCLTNGRFCKLTVEKLMYYNWRLYYWLWWNETLSSSKNY